MVRLFDCDLGIAGSKHRNNLSVCKVKIAYIWLSINSVMVEASNSFGSWRLGKKTVAPVTGDHPNLGKAIDHGLA